MAGSAGSGDDRSSAGTRRPGLLSDPLAALLDLPRVAEAARLARDEYDALLWDRRLRARAAEVRRDSILTGGRESAAIEGAEVPLAEVLAGGGVDGSPVGAVLGAALRVTAEVPTQVSTWHVAPLQVLARLHLLAARDMCPADDLGRPRTADHADDPLHLPRQPSAVEAVARLEALSVVLTSPTEAPALVVAAIAHAELLATRPFTWGSGLVARAVIRLVLADRGVDPDCLVPPEHGLRVMGRGAYAAALAGYISGTEDGVGEWIVWHCGAVGYAAEQVRASL